MTTLINLTLPVNLLTARVGTGDSEVFALPAKVSVLSWQTSFDTAPSAIEISLQVSIDGVNFVEIDSSTDTAGELRLVDGVVAAMFIKAEVVTNTGNKQVTVVLLAKENP